MRSIMAFQIYKKYEHQFFIVHIFNHESGSQKNQPDLLIFYAFTPNFYLQSEQVCVYICIYICVNICMYVCKLN